MVLIHMSHPPKVLGKLCMVQKIKVILHPSTATVFVITIVPGDSGGLEYELVVARLDKCVCRQGGLLH